MNLEAMFRDMDTTKSLMDLYKSSKIYDENDGVEFSVSILTQASWPTYDKEQIYLPEIVSLSV